MSRVIVILVAVLAAVVMFVKSAPAQVCPVGGCPKVSAFISAPQVGQTKEPAVAPAKPLAQPTAPQYLQMPQMVPQVVPQRMPSYGPLPTASPCVCGPGCAGCACGCQSQSHGRFTRVRTFLRRLR